MKPNVYRECEIDCSVKGVKRGKAGIKWNCVIHITGPDGKAYSDLEIIVSAWSAGAARGNGVNHAKSCIDEYLGPEAYGHSDRHDHHVSMASPIAGGNMVAQIVK
jgi:hypothetical protein